MKKLMLIAALAATAALSATPSMAAGHCVLAGGEANMATEGLAKFMAEAALKNSISGKGMKPAGKIVMKCESAGLVTHCLARQRACK